MGAKTLFKFRKKLSKLIGGLIGLLNFIF